MTIQTMTISLPGDMREYLDNRTQADKFGNASEYVCDLIRPERDRRAQPLLDEQLINNLRSPQVEWVPEVRERLLATVENRIAKRCPPRSGALLVSYSDTIRSK
jgi:Arc/MetJ-type ribon-helix-helix transcriptional regulator